MLVTGVSKETLKMPFFQLLNCQMGKTHLKHSFVYMPECPIPLTKYQGYLCP